MDGPVAFLNGRWVTASLAAVPVGDAGFMLGATVAEQVRTFAGKPFRLDAHIARLASSLEIVGLDAGMTPSQLAQTAQELVARNYPLLSAGDDLGLTIFVTPGLYAAYAPPGPTHPTVCLHTFRLPFHLWAKKYREGQALVTTAVEQVSPRCWPAGLKCRSRMHYYLADRQAAALDPQARALLVDAQGFVTEASTANLLIYKADEGLISPLWTKVLRGISLATVAELAQRLGVPTLQRDVTPDEVLAADEVLLTSTSICLLPVTRLNGRPIGAGRPGQLFARIIAAWSELVGVDIVGQAERFARPLTPQPGSQAVGGQDCE